MELNKKQQQVRININELKISITKSIDKVCVDKDYDITYAEINSALTDILRSNLGYELKEQWESK